ncbi:hypothetical protein Nepgr_010799 [Nepenthes gracilis]|uniref:RRM domain-containing protein n=1 Tax=Nepenthes gracilis TaxID=150966 RepID=A0AAD3SE26_NEPGR|nr:hypothetical protein Nepgr_010799 [Nepenthes gracilis]
MATWLNGRHRFYLKKWGSENVRWAKQKRDQAELARRILPSLVPGPHSAIAFLSAGSNEARTPYTVRMKSYLLEVRNDIEMGGLLLLPFCSATLRSLFRYYRQVYSLENFQYQIHLVFMDPNGATDETCGRRLYVGNIDRRISEATLIRLFSPYGEVQSSDFLWHTCGARQGWPCGFAYIWCCTNETAGDSSSRSVCEGNKSTCGVNSHGEMSRSAKIAAIKNKLKALEEGFSCRSKKQKQ